MDTCTQTKDKARVVFVEDEIAACDEDFSGSGDGDRHCGEEVIRAIGGWCLGPIYILGGVHFEVRASIIIQKHSDTCKERIKKIPRACRG